MKRKFVVYGCVAALAMLTIILDTKTAANSAAEGLTLCIRTIIPSLFPFFILSGVINSCLLGQRIFFLRPLGRFCKIPAYTESFLVLGFLAGYPVGAQLIAQAYREGKLSHSTAERMLGFCNNAGPSFLFGMLSPLFASGKTVWCLWGIHIASALLAAHFLPCADTDSNRILPSRPITLPQSMNKAIRAMANVCGWVIIFRVLIGFFKRWFLWYFSDSFQVLFSGVLELANGCVMLSSISSEWLRFVLASGMLAFGGACVGMQTMSVCEGLGTGKYFPGKLLQTIIAVLLCFLLRPIIFT